MLEHQGSRDMGSEQVSDLENCTASMTYKPKCLQSQLKNMPQWVSEGACSGAGQKRVFRPESQGSSARAVLLFLFSPPTDLVWKHFRGHFLLLYSDKTLGSITEI